MFFGRKINGFFEISKKGTDWDIGSKICANVFFWAQRTISGQKSWFRPIPANLSNFEKFVFFVIFMIFVKWNVTGIGREWPEPYIICRNTFSGCFRCLLHQKSIFYRLLWENYMYVKTTNKKAFLLKIWIFSISFSVDGFHTHVISSIKYQLLMQKTSKMYRECILIN